MAMKDAIMNFEIESMDLSGAAAYKADALVLLVPQSFKPVNGVLADLIAAALKTGDLETKPGKLLAMYNVDGVACKRVVLAGCEAGTTRQVRQAVAAAVAGLKVATVRKVPWAWRC